MAVPGSNDIKDQTIFQLVQILQAKDFELNDLRAENKALRVEMLKLKVKDECVQTDVSGPGNIEFSEAHLNKSFILDTSQIEKEKTYDSKLSGNDTSDSGLYETINATGSFEKTGSFKHQKAADSSFHDCESFEQLTREESTKPMKKRKKKRLRNTLSRKLSLKKGPKDETTQKYFMRYQMSTKRVSLKRKGSSKEADKKNAQANQLAEDELNTTSKTVENWTSSDQAPTTEDVKTKMALITPNPDFLAEGHLLSFSSSDNYDEMNWFELRDNTSLKTALPNTPKGNENEDQPNNQPVKRFDYRGDFKKKYQFWETRVNESASTSQVECHKSDAEHTSVKKRLYEIDEKSKISFV